MGNSTKFTIVSSFLSVSCQWKCCFNSDRGIEPSQSTPKNPRFLVHGFSSLLEVLAFSWVISRKKHSSALKWKLWACFLGQRQEWLSLAVLTAIWSLTVNIEERIGCFLDRLECLLQSSVRFLFKSFALTFEHPQRKLPHMLRIIDGGKFRESQGTAGARIYISSISPSLLSLGLFTTTNAPSSAWNVTTTSHLRLAV
jgi:hypothetical protein